MKSFIDSLSPRRRFIALQVIAGTIATALPLLLHYLATWILDPLLVLTGASVGIVAMARAGRKNATPRRLVLSSLLVWLGCAAGWYLVAMVLGLLASSLDGVDTRYSYPGIAFTHLPLFTTACVAYFELGPFRPRS
jgi:hypothetical protein